eukprot:jgi/Bigna1/69158/fgenesh1_pg.8_\
MAKTQKNKATEYHLGRLKGKIAALRAQLISPRQHGGGGAERGFEAGRSGDARVALIGFPSVISGSNRGQQDVVGKSTFLTNLTNTTSKVAGYEFTTLTCIPGVFSYKQAEIQILDLPCKHFFVFLRLSMAIDSCLLGEQGIIEGASQGVGKGRQVIAAARTADLVIWHIGPFIHGSIASRGTKENARARIRGAAVLLAAASRVYWGWVGWGGEGEGEGEGEFVDVPDIWIHFTSTFNLEGFDKHLATDILADQRIRNAEVQLREKDITIERFIDAVTGNIKYIPALYICNKVDKLSYKQFENLVKKPNYVLISCHRSVRWLNRVHNVSLIHVRAYSFLRDWNMKGVREAIYNALKPIRVYTKRPKTAPDLNNAIVLCKGRHTVADLCRSIHSSLADPNKFYYANVWGTSVKFRPQRVGLAHILQDEDVVQVMLRRHPVTARS